MKSKFLNIQVWALLFLALLASCKKSTDTAETLTRPFSPVAFTSTVTGVDVDFTWTPGSSLTYLLELSTDAEFKKDVTPYQVGKVGQYKVEGLLNNTDYFARLKVLRSGDQLEDSKYVSLTFKTLVEQIFKESSLADVTGTDILVNWDATKQVDRLVISALNKADVTVQLTAAEKTAGQKTFTSLNYLTAYTFKIYLGDRLRGTKTISTASSGFVASVYTASHTAAGSDPNNAIDGNEATFWQGAAVSKVYFILDLKKRYDVTKITIKWDGQYYPKIFDIVYSNTPFQSLDASSNLIGTTLTYNNPDGFGPVVNEVTTPFTAQYVAIQTRGRNTTPPYAGTHARIIEMNVTGKPTP